MESPKILFGGLKRVYKLWWKEEGVRVILGEVGWREKRLF